MNHLTPHLDSDSEERAILEQNARQFFSGIDGAFRDDGSNAGLGYSQEIWRQMVDLGWAAWRIPADVGGSDLSHSLGVVLHEECGAAAAPEPLVDVAVLAAGILRRSPRARYNVEELGLVAEGRTLACLVWSPATASEADSGDGIRGTLYPDGSVTLAGTIGFASLPEADSFLVLADTPTGSAIFRVERSAPGLEIARQLRIDRRYWAELRLSDVRLSSDSIVIEPGRAQEVLDEVLDEGRLALSAELLGAAAEVFDITLDYLRVRQQFGRPLASYQALQHRAVDIAVELELIRSVVQHTAAKFDTCTDRGERAGAVSQAKARASSGALEIILGCIQLHGGIAYTEECRLGAYLKRAMVQASWLGDASYHQRRGAKYEFGARRDSPDRSAAVSWLEEMRTWIDANLDSKFRFPAKRQTWREAHEWHVRLFEKGWVAPSWPKEFGGLGLSPYEEIQLQELYDSFGMNIFQNMGLTMLGPLLQKHGTPEQQAKYLPGILSGETYWCQGYSEPEAGSDLASLRTRAVLEGDHFVVNGQKIWTSLAHEASMIFLLVRTDPAAKRQEGISFLLVDLKSPGITIKPIVNLTGSRDFCAVFFDDVRVPKENVVGALNQGWSMAKSVLGSERIMIGHPRFAKAALNILRQLVESGKAEGAREILRVAQSRVADIEALYIRYLDALKDGKNITAETSVLKICSSQCWQYIAKAIREFAGLRATLDERLPISGELSANLPFQFLHAIPSTIYGGTNEIQRNILAKTLLKL